MTRARTIGLSIWMLAVGVVPLGAGGCLSGDQPFDLDVVRGASATALVTHGGAAGTADVKLWVGPHDAYECYDVPADLQITANGTVATSVVVDAQDPLDGLKDDCSRFRRTLIATFTIPDTDGPVTIELARGNAQAVMELQPPAHPPLALAWPAAAEGSASGDGVLGNLTPAPGAAQDVPAGTYCWNAWLCPPDATDSTCSPREPIDVRSERSSTGARLTFGVLDHTAAGVRSLWLGPTPGYGCGTASVARCSGIASCTADVDNHGYLLGPYTFRVL